MFTCLKTSNQSWVAKVQLGPIVVIYSTVDCQTPLQLDVPCFIDSVITQKLLCYYTAITGNTLPGSGEIAQEDKELAVKE